MVTIFSAFLTSNFLWQREEMQRKKITTSYFPNLNSWPDLLKRLFFSYLFRVITSFQRQSFISPSEKKEKTAEKTQNHSIQWYTNSLKWKLFFFLSCHKLAWYTILMVEESLIWRKCSLEKTMQAQSNKISTLHRFSQWWRGHLNWNVQECYLIFFFFSDCIFIGIFLKTTCSKTNVSE